MDDSGKRRAALVGGVALYAIGAGFLGGIVGLLTGMSQTSVVSTVLGAAFALLGAAGSFYLPWSQALPTTTRQTAADAAVLDVIPRVADKKAALTIAMEATQMAASAHAVAANAATEAQTKVSALADDTTDEQRSVAQTALAATEEERSTAEQALGAARKVEDEASKAAEQAMALLTETVNEADAAAGKARDLASDGFAKTYLVSGSALLLFSLGFGLALMYGVLLRTGTNWGDLTPQVRVIELPPGADAATLADAAILDRILAGLRVEPKTRDAIISQLNTSCAKEAGREEMAIKSVKNAMDVARKIKLKEVSGTTTALQALFEESDLYAKRDMIRSALLEATELAQLSENTTQQPDFTAALNTFIATSVDFLYCSGSDVVVANIIANLKELEGTALKESLSSSVSVEDGLNR